MALIHISNALGTQIFPLIEDPNTATNRIFLSGMGHDMTYVVPQFGSYFHLNGQNFVSNATPLGLNLQANYTGAIRLIGNSISTQAYFENNTGSDRDVHTAYHRSLDPVNYPAKLSWYTTVTNKCLMQTTYSSEAPGNATPPNQSYVFGSDVTLGYYLSYQSSTANASYPNNFYYEDTVSNATYSRTARLWGTTQNCPPQEGIVFVTNYDNPQSNPTVTSVAANNQGTDYFLGTDALQSTYWVRHFDNQTGEPYNIVRYTWAGTATTLTTSTNINAYVPQGATYYHRRPSNLRTDSSTKRVFYSSHYDVNGNLAPVRFVWDPTNTLGTGASTPPPVNTSTCTMVYGSTVAVGSYTFYATSYSQTGVGGNNADAWHTKPYQFQPFGTSTWYITFFISDKANTTTNATSRWSTAKQRTMMTYTIGNTTTNFDNTLTFHSAYTFQDQYNIPRDWLPVNPQIDGTIVVTPTYAKTPFMRFSTTSGWYVSSTYPYQLETCGLDQQNRFWGLGREIGNYSIHFLNNQLPTQVSVVMPNQNYTYTGTNILTTASLYAYNWGGDLITATIYLSIQGNSMLFTDNGTVSQTYTTSAVTGTNVNLTITGAGISNVVVGAAI
jgi:hypothetical protein